MKNWKLTGCVLAVLMSLASVLPSAGQEIKLVTGRIINKTTMKPFDPADIIIYSFNTVGEAEDSYKTLTQDGGYIFATNMISPDAGGYYEVRVSETGAIIVKGAGKEMCMMEKVNYRMEINFEMEGGIELPPATLNAKLSEPAPMKERNVMNGNNLEVSNTIPLPDHFGKTNARLILQPILYDGGTDKLLKYLDPMVFDGEQYSLTQERRMAYDRNNDPLTKFVNKEPLRDTSMIVSWSDTVKVSDPDKSYYVNGVMRLEDYNQIYYERKMLLASARSVRPLKFLQYTMDQYYLDPEEYKEKPRRERRNTAGNISLTFLVGKAELDDSDTTNRAQLGLLKNDLLNIVQGEGSQLKEFFITGISSPDGSYQSNLKLARERMRYALSQITSVLSKHVRDRVYMRTEAEVAPWSAVVDLLTADSLMTEAAGLQEIIDKYPDNHDAQSIRIRQLPYYRDVVVDYLPKLRSVKYEYNYEIYRELTPEEIMDRYENDGDYRSGRKEFALYEFWNLFRMVEDPDELEVLYKRAYDASIKETGRPWALAANNLAVAYLRKDKADTTILAPLIDAKIKRVNVIERRADGTVNSVINPEAVVANQISMYLKMRNFERASVLAQLLPDTEKNRVIKAFTLCLGGYYIGGDTPEEQQQAKEVFNVVANSTPLNKVVMCLAMDNKAYTSMASQAINALPQDDPLTYYLWAIIKCRESQEQQGFDAYMIEMDAESWLLKAFQGDKKYVGLASADGDILESVFKNANEMYEDGTVM